MLDYVVQLDDADSRKSFIQKAGDIRQTHLIPSDYLSRFFFLTGLILLVLTYDMYQQVCIS